MIRVVFDTNVIISGCLWSGAPRQALYAAYEGNAKLLISEAMVDELKDVLGRPKFAKRLELLKKSAEQVLTEHLRFTDVIEVQSIPATILADPDDDQVLACALSGNADFIVTGDVHLLDLESHKNIPIISVNTFLERIAKDNGD
jgi:putative PIN family toxin of toxin-antitoxin system